MKQKPKRFFAIIPSSNSMSADELPIVKRGGWPVRITELLPQHLAFIDFLVGRAVEEWERSAGK